MKFFHVKKIKLQGIDEGNVGVFLWGGGEEMRFHIHDIYPENLTDYIKLRQHKLSYCPKGIAFKQYKFFLCFKLYSVHIFLISMIRVIKHLNIYITGRFNHFDWFVFCLSLAYFYPFS